jgi:dolichyl-phosphate-mannose-protein mannosyltransferase
VFPFSSWRPAARSLLLVLSLLYTASALVAVATGGYYFQILGLRLSSRRPLHDGLLALTFASLRALAGGLARAELNSRRLLDVIERYASRAAALAAAALFAVGVWAGTYCACGSDAYGYVSEARLWLDGSLHVPEPLAAAAPWPNALSTFAPLGYTPARAGAAIVPTYPPGYPLLMAAALAVGRAPAVVFLVVPIAGALTVWLTFLIGLRLHSTTVGLFGALLVASSPTFLQHLVQPMSDVPATAAWLLVAVLVFDGTPPASFASGLAASLAILIRPNLAPLAALPALYALASRGWKSAAAFAAGALPGPIGIALLQQRLYGSPFTSGYGDVPHLFHASNVLPNLTRYPRWLFESHGPAIAVGLVGPLLVRKRVAIYALAFSAALLLVYLGYRPFENWTYSRFLLPAIPFLLLLSVWTGFVVVERWTPSDRRGAAAVALLLATGFAIDGLLRSADDHRVLLTRVVERRYKEIAREVQASGDVLALAMQHSGSLRYHVGVTTVRYDNLDPAWLDRAIGEMRAWRRGPLIVLEDWEERGFRARFAGQHWGALDWPPRVEVTGAAVVRIYDPADRDAPQAVRTTRIALK